MTTRTRARAPVQTRSCPYRRTFVISEALIAASALAGTAMLLTDTGAPDVSAIRSLGLHSWTLPGLWLFASVVVPSTTAAVLALRRHTRAPDAVMAAGSLLLLELAVQVPFLGFDPLQPTMAAAAVALGVSAHRARAGWVPVRSGAAR